LDAFDRKLLALVQRNTLQTHEALGTAVGLSPSAVRRRLHQLRASGVIVADVAIVEPAKLGVTVIVSIRMQEESRASYGAVKARMIADLQISQCYTVAGPVDFMLVGHFADLATYEAWIDTNILSEPTIARSDTAIVYSRIKFETAIGADTQELSVQARRAGTS
jgi:Lrp/AsnC family leucine-responsive transcriptional regulator